jgi:hypothetical protein
MNGAVALWFRAGVVALALAVGAAHAETPLAPAPPISLLSDEGEQLLMQSTARRAYGPLSARFVTQKNLMYCGVATLVMVLNAMEIAAPPVPELEPYRTFTQDNVLDARTAAVLPPQVLLKQGMTLDQFAALAEVHGVLAQVHHADASSIEQFRRLASTALARSGHHVVVNYRRAEIGQGKGVHISPLAAYDEHSDRFLVLDVARYRYPPVWVSTADLFAAMNTPDSSNGDRRRGFVLVRTER